MSRDKDIMEEHLLGMIASDYWMVVSSYQLCSNLNIFMLRMVHHMLLGHMNSQLVFGLLDRLYHLHKLYSAARPLCCHEVSTMLCHVLFGLPCYMYAVLLMSHR